MEDKGKTRQRQDAVYAAVNVGEDRTLLSLTAIVQRPVAQILPELHRIHPPTVPLRTPIRTLSAMFSKVVLIATFAKSNRDKDLL